MGSDAAKKAWQTRKFRKKGFSPHKKRGAKKLSSPVEEPQGKGQWGKQKPFFTDDQKRVRVIRSLRADEDQVYQLARKQTEQALASGRYSKKDIRQQIDGAIFKLQAMSMYSTKGGFGGAPDYDKIMATIRALERIKAEMKGDASVSSRAKMPRTTRIKPKYPSKVYGSYEITFRDDDKGNVLASIDDRKDVAKGADFQEAFRNAKKIIHQDYELEHGVTKTKRKFKSKARPLKQLQAEQDKKWEEIQKAEKEARERGVTDPEKLFAIRMKIVKKYEKKLKKPDLKPIIYRVTIGHYGGYFIEVPEEHFEEFKNHFLPREFPMKVETIDVRKKSLGAEKRFRQRFPNSNKIKQVYFADRNVGTKRLDFLELPRSE